MADATDLGSVP